MTIYESGSEYDAKAFALQLADALNGVASSDDLEQLNALLSRSEEAREVAINFFKDESLLHEELHGCAVKSSFHTDLAIPLYELARDNAADSASEEDQGVSLEKRSGLKSRGSRYWLASLITLAATVAIMWIALSPSDKVLPVAKSTTIRLENCSDTVFAANGNQLHPGAPISVGETVFIESGMAELQFESGVQVILKGPASFQIVSTKHVILSRGVLTATVEEAAHGFRIDTPTVQVTDLGTEFGVAVSDRGETEVVVFSGKVALQQLARVEPAPQPTEDQPEESLPVRGRFILEGEGLRVRGDGEIERMVSLNTSDFPRSFRSSTEIEVSAPVIASVSDNQSSENSIKCYQIVHHGFGEDVQAFSDRRYQWNGINAEHGLPKMLIDADYVLPACDDKFNGRLKIMLQLAQPARVFVLIDNRLKLPRWLKNGFEDTGYDVAVDEDSHNSWRTWQELGQGPGKSLERSCSVWFKDVSAPTTVSLGAVEPPTDWSLMYGIAAIPLSTADLFPAEPAEHHTPKIGSGLIRTEFLPTPLAETDVQSGKFYQSLTRKMSKVDAAAYSKGLRIIPESFHGEHTLHQDVRLVEGAIPSLNDGLESRNNQDLARNVWFTGQGRFSLDFKRSVDIDSINCFSRHMKERSWQYFTVWGSNAEQKPSVQFDRPEQAEGWDYIGLVDSRAQPGDIHASSLHAPGGSIGTYRHLLWICEQAPYSTYFTEIDVHEAE